MLVAVHKEISCTMDVSTGIEQRQDAGHAARTYTEHGRYVLPVNFVLSDGTCSCRDGAKCGRSAGKHPYGLDVPNGLLGATRLIEFIDKWWRDTPTLNVGVRTLNFIAIDEDCKNGKDGFRDAARVRS